MLKQQRGSVYYRSIAQRGGQTCLERHGAAHFTRIGKQGGTTTRERYGSEFYSNIGKKGAQARARKSAVKRSGKADEPEGGHHAG